MRGLKLLLISSHLAAHTCLCYTGEGKNLAKISFHLFLSWWLAVYIIRSGKNKAWQPSNLFCLIRKEEEIMKKGEFF